MNYPARLGQLIVSTPNDSAEQAATERVLGWLQLTTAWKHASQFPTAQKDWLGREATVPLDPGANWGGIGGSDEASLRGGGIVPTLPVDPAGRVEAQHGFWRDADPIPWDCAQHERAGGEAWPIDYDSLTRLPQQREQFEIRSYLAARTCQNAYIGASERHRDEKPKSSNERTSHRSLH
jgi:hypothetical protein